VGVRQFLLMLGDEAVRAALNAARLERAIGGIYRPETERVSHYFRADMPRQFDAVYHFDETKAVEPLEVPERWRDAEPPETYPTGF
jgi:erythromycin esterase-like protein